jgi:hypothetical protein
MAFNLIATDNAGVPAFLQEMGGYQDEGLSAGIQARAPKIGISTDKHFTITRDGVTTILETVMTDNAGNKHAVPVQSMRVVIVAASNTLTKAWYEQAYVPGSNAAPECYSNDGKVPAPGVAKPQCANCAQCPKNAFGSHPTTGRGKACADRKMVVAVWEGAPDELMTWNVSTTSLQSLAKFDTELRNANIPMQSVLVELMFDPGIQYPVVKLSALGFVDKETALKLKNLSQTAEVASLLREVDYEPAAAASSPVPQNTLQFGASQASQQAEPQQQQQQQQQQTQQQAPAQDKPKRARRTAAQIEADRQAAAGQQPQQQQQQQQQGGGHEIELEQPLEDIKQETQQILQQQQPQQTQQPSQADIIAQLQAQLAAAQGAQQTQQVQPQQVIEQAAQQVQPQQTQAQPSTTVQPSGNVASLLSQWASKK